jgi:hypothetical protein
MVMMVQIPGVGSSAGKKYRSLGKDGVFKSLTPCVISNMGKDKRGSDDHSIQQETRGTKGRGKRQLVRKKYQHQTLRNGSRKE